MSTTTATGTRVGMARAHLETLYGNADRGVAVLYLKDEGVSRFYDVADPGALDAMAADAVLLSDAATVYFGVNLIAARLPETRRGSAVDVLTVVGFVNDCDIRPGDPTKPHGLGEVAAFAKTLPLTPSLVVRSGGGAHLYALFNEPWLIESDAERRRIEQASRAWGRFVQHRAAERGWTFDTVSDLARVLRLPGTLNHKPDYPEPILVELVHESGLRYELTDVEDVLPESAFDDEPIEAPDEGKVPLSERHIAAIVETLRPVRRDGIRHALSLYLSGWLATNGIAEASALEVVMRVSTTGGDVDVAQKVKNARDTYASLRAERRPLGWNGLKQLQEQGRLTAAQLEALDKVLRRTHTVGGKTYEPGAASMNGSGPAAGGADGELWRDLQPLPGPSAVPTLPPEMLPEGVRSWLADIAYLARIPLEMVAAPAIVGLGSVVGRGVGIRPWRFNNFVTVPNLWGVVVARPGWMKSYAVAEALSPIGKLAATARERYERDKEAAEVDVAALTAQLKAIEGRMNEAAKKGAALDALKEEYRAKKADLKAAIPVERRYLTHDATIEKLGEILRNNPRGMLVVRDELYGLLRSFERSGRENDRQFYLEGWNGTDSFTSDRIARGTIHIPALTLSIIGGIQPGRLRPLIEQAASTGSDDDGLLQRFQVFVWPDRLEPWRRPERWPDGTARDAAFAIYASLDRVAPSDVAATRDREDGIPYATFTPGAQRLADAWHDDLECRLRSNDLDDTPAYAAHLAKYRSLMPSFALVFHLVDVASGRVSPGRVGEPPTRLAAAWCDYLDRHARKLYDVELDKGKAAARALAAKIEANAIVDGMPSRDIYRHHWSGLATDEAVIAGLTVLADHGWVRLQSVGTGGRASQIVRLHPHLHRSGSHA